MQAIKTLLMSKSMNKVIKAIINGNNMQKIKVSSQPKGNVCVCVCVECPISVVLGTCITVRFNLGQAQYFILFNQIMLWPIINIVCCMI